MAMAGRGRKPTRPRDELEALVQSVDRKHPEWSSAQVEKELETLSPVLYGNWKDDTPKARSRSRQIQRWRTGQGGPGHRGRERLPFHYLWPVGERQRHAIEPEFALPNRGVRASHRVFLYNCSPETLRELRVRLAGQDVAYEPAVAAGKFAEVHWTKSGKIRAAALAARGNERLVHPLIAEFAVAGGMKRAMLEGDLTMLASDGWVSFACREGESKEIE